MTAVGPRRALLVAAAPSTQGRCEIVRSVATEVDTVIGVDGGAALCLQCGVVPDVVVGDMDSLAPKAAEQLRQAGARFVVASTEKDVTDLDIAFEYCTLHAYEDVVVTACTGGRIDHSLAAIGTIARGFRLQPRIVEPGSEGWILEPTARGLVRLPKVGATFSVIAVGTTARVSVTGARWPLDSAAVEPLSSLGVSNVVGADGAVVQVHEGIVLVLTNLTV